MTDNQSPEQARDEMLKDLYTNQLASRITNIAHRLRTLADDMDREAERARRVPSQGAACGADIAHDVVHALSWAFANLSPAGVISAAAAFDREVLGGQR